MMRPFVRAILASLAVLAASSSSSSNNKFPRRSGKFETLEKDEHEYFFRNRNLEDYGDGYDDGGGNDYYDKNGDEGYGDGYSSNGYDSYANDGYSSSGYGDSYGSSSSNTYEQPSSTSSPYGTSFFADSQQTYYDGYQQAWRYLGHLVKCGAPSNRYYEDEDSHSQDEDDDDRYRGNNWCQRFLVWAAYVDLNYEGGGIGEYYYYDPYSSSWDYTACDTHGSSSGRCAPMDCHQSNTTTWTLMGVYKEAEYFGDDAFFEQLFKHEGYCLWNDYDLYEFMSDTRESAWPEGCVQTDTYLADEDGNSMYLYLDLKPTYNGNMTYGLYVDETCKYEYRGSKVSVESVAQGMGLLYGGYLQAWNDALEVYKVCQPCMAYNLQVTSAQNNNYYNNDDNYDNQGNDDNSNNYGNSNNQWWNWWNRQRKLGNDDDGYSSYDVNEGYFQCDDDADYTNVNQCMKFRSHAELEVASWEDLVIATEQGGILDVNIGGTIFGTEKMSYEQQLYKEEVRLAKEKEEEAEYQALLASVPSALPMETAGLVSTAAGVFTFLSVLLWVWMKGARARRDARYAKRTEANTIISDSQTAKDLSEPLANDKGTMT